MPRYVAFDLALSGRSRLVVPRILPFGDLNLQARRLPRDRAEEGAFEFALSTKRPKAFPDENRAELRRFVGRECVFSAEGSLRIRRDYDAEAGVVRSFEATLTLWFEEAKGRWRKIVFEDRWRLREIHENQDAWFRGAVAEAIDDGRRWLLRELKNLERRHLLDGGENRSYGSGRIALGLLTLLHCGVAADDPVVVAGFEELGRRELIDTYSLGLALMAMSARHAPPGERESLRSGRLAAPTPRDLSPAERKLADRWLATLLGNTDERADRSYRLRFNYTPAPRWDNSVNQYGLLGLHAASLCRLDVPVTLWRAAAEHLLEVPGRKEGARRLEVATYRDLAARRLGEERTVSAKKVQPFGWSYRMPAQRPVCGAMTTAGLTGLALARAGMLRAGRGKSDLLPKVEAAIDAGFGWLDAHFDVRSNPGYVGRAGRSWFYYLYGLERACELCGVARIGGRDWYFEGALQLLHHQRRDGSWPTGMPGSFRLESTCFAILFLKKATSPALTGR